MNKVKAALSLIISFALIAPSAMAADVEVKWIKPDKFRDVRASNNESRKRFLERTIKQFETHFAKMAEELPANQTLKIEVTDVDLAGDVNYGGIDRIRIVKDIYFPRIEFSYELVNADQSSVISGEETLKDMSFLRGNNLKYRNDSLGYEKKLLDEWFKATFTDYIVK